jgi:hypothetical protein
MMNRLASVFGFLALGAILMIIEPANLPDTFLAQAEAVIGRPLTPISYAGVARRTTRRTVYAASTPTTVVVTEDNSYEQQQVEQTPAQQSALPIGATLPSLPAGCGSNTVNNQSYFSCGVNWFRPAMQNGNIVYAVVADPR